MNNELLELAKIAGVNAGKAILKHYQDFTLFKKEDKSPLTSADLAANDEIFKILSKTGIQICSEESILDAKIRTNLDKFWLIDPLDGTKEFIAQNGEFCVCIALIEYGRPTLAVIYIPCLDEIFYSAGDKKVYKNGEILTPKNQTPNLFLLGRSGKSERREMFAKTFSYAHQRVGSAIKFCRLAENQAAAYARFGDSSLWDVAAGDFLVEQSGGAVIDLKTKKPPLYNGDSLINNHYLAIDKNNVKFIDEMLEFIQNSG